MEKKISIDQGDVSSILQKDFFFVSKARLKERYPLAQMDICDIFSSCIYGKFPHTGPSENFHTQNDLPTFGLIEAHCRSLKKKREEKERKLC